MILGCCCGEPLGLETKHWCMTFGFFGVGEFYENGGNPTNRTGWLQTKYLVQETFRDVTGILYGDELVGVGTITTTVTRDPINNSTTTSTVTTGSPGSLGAAGAITFVSATHWWQAYDYGEIHYYLDSAHQLDDVIAEAQSRADILMPNASLRPRQDITAGDDIETLLPAVRDWGFLSEGATYPAIRIAPTGGYPWDGTYQHVGNYGSGAHFQSMLLGGYPVTGALGSGADWLTGSSPNWVAGGGSISFCILKSCLSLPYGLNCDLTEHDADENYAFGDLVLISLNLTTGDIDETAAEIELAPGVYTFDGNRIYINSGSIISPAGDVDGIKNPSAGYYGMIAVRSEPGIGYITEVADYCPP